LEAELDQELSVLSLEAEALGSHWSCLRSCDQLHLLGTVRF